MKEVFRFKSTDRTHDLYTAKWLPNTEPKAIVQIIHGMEEHIERYEEFASFLCDHGVLVIGNDLLGHGRSANKDERGFFAKGDPCRTLVEDIHRLRLLTQGGYPGIPYFMMGHSMGSYLLRTYLGDYSDDLSGAIILGTGYINPATSIFGVGAAKALSKIKGGRSYSKVLPAMAFGSNSYRQFDLIGKEPGNSWLSKDIEQVNKYYSDDLCKFDFTINGYIGLFQAVNRSCTASLAGRMNKDLPILIASGEDDPVGDMGKGVRKVYELFMKAGIRDLTLKLYESDRHEILGETDKDQVFADLLEWMEKRITD